MKILLELPVAESVTETDYTLLANLIEDAIEHWCDHLQDEEDRKDDLILLNKVGVIRVVGEEPMYQSPYEYHLSIPLNIDFTYESESLLNSKEVIENISNDCDKKDYDNLPMYDEGMVVEDFIYNIKQNPHLIKVLCEYDGKEIYRIEGGGDVSA